MSRCQKSSPSCPQTQITLWTGRKSAKRTFEMISFDVCGLAGEAELMAHIEKLKTQTPQFVGCCRHRVRRRSRSAHLMPHAFDLRAAFNHGSLPSPQQTPTAPRLVSRTQCRTLLARFVFRPMPKFARDGMIYGTWIKLLPAFCILFQLQQQNSFRSPSMNAVLPDREAEHRLVELVVPGRPILKIRPEPKSWCFETVLARCADNQLADAMLDLRRRNAAFIGEHDKIVVVIDGRLGKENSGYLGDAVQGTRVLRPLQKHFGATRVIVASSHAGIIDSSFGPRSLPECDSVSPLRVDNNEPYWNSISSVANSAVLLSPTLGRLASPLNFGRRQL